MTLSTFDGFAFDAVAFDGSIGAAGPVTPGVYPDPSRGSTRLKAGYPDPSRGSTRLKAGYPDPSRGVTRITR